MTVKKINASLALLSIACMLAHICYSVFAYLTMYYNPFLKYATAIPAMVATCLHAVLGMLLVFTQADGTRLDLYPRQNLGTLLQRVSAALIFPLLILHINTFGLMSAAAGEGQIAPIYLLILAEVLFFAVIITHMAVSLSKALVTMGWLTSQQTRERIDRAAYVIGAILFVVTSYAIVRTQAAMFLG